MSRLFDLISGRNAICLLFLFIHQSSLADTPSAEFILSMASSMVKVHVEDKNSQHGIGSGAVVATNHVATNCHVVAHAKGVAVNKLGNSYAPIAMIADWPHDLCILIFDDLPLQPFALGDSNQLNYEQHIVALGYSGNSPKPIESFGSVKAFIPLDDSHLIRTSSGFRMGASGGALLDYNGNLVGLTTLKSPGRKGYYYSIPVEWIKALLAKPKAAKMSEATSPFWDVPEQERPFFMQVVIPYQNEMWSDLELISSHWVKREEKNPEALFYLGLAQQGLKNLSAAKESYHKTLQLAPTHSGAIYALGVIALSENQPDEAKRLGEMLENIDKDFAEEYYIATGIKKNPST